MGDCCLLFDNRADDATLSNGTFTAAAPRDNMKDYRLGKYAQTQGNGAAATTFRASFASAIYVQALALIATNLTTAATVRWRIYSDSGFTTVAWDSTAIAVYPAGSMPNTQIPAGAPNAGTGKPTAAELARFQNNAIHLLGANARHAQYIQCDISDPGNPDPGVRIGRLFVGRVFQPAYGVAYGDVQLQLASRTTQQQARDGTPYFSRQRPNFSIPIALRYLTEDEAMAALDLQALVDTDGEVVVIWNPEIVAYRWRRQVLGRLKQLDPLQYPMFANYAASFQVEGVL